MLTDELRVQRLLEAAGRRLFRNPSCHVDRNASRSAVVLVGVHAGKLAAGRALTEKTPPGLLAVSR
jgi:hypothetical protein